MGFANPVGGVIHERTWSRPSGNLEFKVTSTFAEHVASGRGPGIDLGNTQCGAPVYAMEAGTVSFQGLLDAAPYGKALVVRIRHTGALAAYETGYAHLATATVRLGQVVARRQLIGTLGSTGAAACHLHGGCKKNGVEVDWWPLLDQQETNVTTIVDAVKFLGADGKPAGRTVSFAAGTYTGYKLDGSKKNITLAAASSAPSDALCTITQVPDKDPHGPNWLRITAGALQGYYIRIGTGITVPPNPPLGGYTQAQLDAAVKAAKHSAAAAVNAAANSAAGNFPL